MKCSHFNNQRRDQQSQCFLVGDHLYCLLSIIPRRASGWIDQLCALTSVLDRSSITLISLAELTFWFQKASCSFSVNFISLERSSVRLFTLPRLAEERHRHAKKVMKLDRARQGPATAT